MQQDTLRTGVRSDLKVEHIFCSSSKLYHSLQPALCLRRCCLASFQLGTRLW